MTTEKIIENDEINIDELVKEFWETKTEYEIPDISFEIMNKLKMLLTAILGAIVICCGISTANTFIAYKEEEAKYESAVSDFDSGYYAKALEEFKELAYGKSFREKANIYIRKYASVTKLFSNAFDLYRDNKFDEAMSTIATLEIIIKPYPQAEKLKDEIKSAKAHQSYKSEQLAKEGIELVKEGNIDEAYDKLEKSVRLAENPGENLEQLKKALALDAAAKIHNAEINFGNGNIEYAKNVLDMVSAKVPDYSGVKRLNKQIAAYYSAVEQIGKAEKFLEENNFAEANRYFEKAVSISPVILKTHSDILQKLKGNTLDKDLMNEDQKSFLDRLEISNVLYTEKTEDEEEGMILLFDIKNISDEPFPFPSYWCQAEINNEVYYPEPATQERYASALKINDGVVEDEFAEDDLVIEPGESYRIMYNFSGTREVYEGAVLYYVDRTRTMVEDGTDGEIENVLKIPLLIIE